MSKAAEDSILIDPVREPMDGLENGPGNAPANAPVIDPNAAQRLAVRASIAQFQSRLLAAGQDFRAPPPEPTTCCGRGCNGCVWEGYEAALAWWYEEARALLGSSEI